MYLNKKQQQNTKQKRNKQNTIKTRTSVFVILNHIYKYTHTCQHKIFHVFGIPV